MCIRDRSHTDSLFNSLLFSFLSVFGCGFWVDFIKLGQELSFFPLIPHSLEFVEELRLDLLDSLHFHLLLKKLRL